MPNLALPLTVPELVAQRAGGPGAASAAVIQGDRRVTYRELAEIAEHHASLLRNHGVKIGDRVAIFARNSMEAIAWYFGALQCDAVAVLVNDSLRSRQVSHILRHSGARVLVTTKRLRSLMDDSDLGGVLPVDIGSGHPLPGTTETGTTSDDAADAPADLAGLIYTSGSTGAPKGVMVTHGNLLAGARIVAQYLDLGPQDRTLSVLPWSFDAGLNQVLATFWAGGSVIIGGSPYPPDVCRQLVAHEATGLAGVPPFWEALVGRPSLFLSLDLPQLRYVTNTGGALRPATIRRIRAAHPGTAVYLMYGLTEAFRSTYLPPHLVDLRPDSIGKAIPECQVMVLDKDGQPCPPGHVGELVHRGPTVAAGYWNDPVATAAVFRPWPPGADRPAGERVVYSGDYVRHDEQGLIYYVGRRDEQFKSRGYRVNPTEIEGALTASEAITAAIVFPLPAGDGERTIVAAIVPATPGSCDERHVLEHCSATMPAYQIPSRIVILDDVPRTSSGKIDRTAIRARIAAEEAVPRD
ncbi:MULTISPECIES: AMP-binding protein [Micromonospora]|uniref:AMP-binding protein n=1 Tax=Micromonospora sp. HUAS YX12 TaxID=3156396 RepID=A0AAU7R4E9_9ACTN